MSARASGTWTQAGVSTFRICLCFWPRGGPIPAARRTLTATVWSRSPTWLSCWRAGGRVHKKAKIHRGEPQRAAEKQAIGRSEGGRFFLLTAFFLSRCELRELGGHFRRDVVEGKAVQILAEPQPFRPPHLPLELQTPARRPQLQLNRAPEPAAGSYPHASGGEVFDRSEVAGNRHLDAAAVSSLEDWSQPAGAVPDAPRDHLRSVRPVYPA